MSSSSEDLNASSPSWLDRFPNFNVDMSASISELGRQPRRGATASSSATRTACSSAPTSRAQKRPQATRGLRALPQTEDDYFGTEARERPPGVLEDLRHASCCAPALQKIYRDNAVACLWPAGADRPAARPCSTRRRRAHTMFRPARHAMFRPAFRAVCLAPPVTRVVSPARSFPSSARSFRPSPGRGGNARSPCRRPSPRRTRGRRSIRSPARRRRPGAVPGETPADTEAARRRRR